MKKYRFGKFTKFFFTSLFILGVTTFLIFVVAEPIAENSETTQQQLLEHKYHTDTINLQTSFDLYVQTLYSTRGFIAAGDEITRKEWMTYFNTIGIVQQLPGLGLLAYIEQVPASEKSTFLTELRNDPILQDQEMNNVVIHPDTAPETYQVAKYIEPYETSTVKSLLGFDFSSEETRRTAFEKARDLNIATSTAPLRFYADQQSGFVMMLPLYRSNQPIVTPEQRRSAYFGLAVISIRIKEVFDESFSYLADSNTLVQVYDGLNTNPDNLIYQNMEVPNPPSKTASSALESVEIADRTLTVKYTSFTPPVSIAMIPSLWARVGILIVTNLVTAVFVWGWVRTSKR